MSALGARRVAIGLPDSPDVLVARGTAVEFLSDPRRHAPRAARLHLADRFVGTLDPRRRRRQRPRDRVRGAAALAIAAGPRRQPPWPPGGGRLSCGADPQRALRRPDAADAGRGRAGSFHYPCRVPAGSGAGVGGARVGAAWTLRRDPVP